MSELKATTVYDAYWKANSVGEGTGILVYLKSEADKVIADLEKRHKKNLDARRYWRKEYLIEYKEARHNKYKRCLAMAKICEDKLGTVVKPGWWDKWRKRWLELAEKFKEEK